MPIKSVIVVPGFLGSTLSMKTTFLGSVRLWASPTALAGSLFRRLALPTNDRPDLPGSETPLIEGGPLGPYYGLLDAFLGYAGFNVYAPVADFRKSIAHDAQTLVDLIRRVQDSGPVGIVCHSRGGLVTRKALAILQASNELGMVSRVVGMGVPHLGSMVACITLAGQHSLQALLERLRHKRLGTWGPSLGDHEVSGVLRSWPSLYELLPHPVHSPLPLDLRLAIYNPATWEGKTLPPYLPHLAAADSQWRNLPDVPEGVQWFDAAGYGSLTAVGVPAGGTLTDKGTYAYTTDGDGVVPHWSCLRPNSRRIFTPCSHDLLPQDGRLWHYVAKALREGLSEDVIIEGRLLSM